MYAAEKQCVSVQNRKLIFKLFITTIDSRLLNKLLAISTVRNKCEFASRIWPVTITINQQRGVAQIGSHGLDMCSMRQYKE